MTEEQRDLIILLTRKHYEIIQCKFPAKTTEDLVDYLYESMHGTEINCLVSAIEAHNIYNKDTMNIDEFYEWHGL